MSKAREEAQCPDCLGWSEVAWDGSVPPGGFWWADSGGCPKCGSVVCVESECEFRKVSGMHEPGVGGSGGAGMIDDDEPVVLDEDARCECGEPATYYGPDPFAKKIWDDETPVHLCDACYRESFLDT